jgi:hypothetical protein
MVAVESIFDGLINIAKYDGRDNEKSFNLSSAGENISSFPGKIHKKSIVMPMQVL